MWQLTVLFRGLSTVLHRQHVPRHPPRALSRLSDRLVASPLASRDLKLITLILRLFADL